MIASGSRASSADDEPDGMLALPSRSRPPPEMAEEVAAITRPGNVHSRSNSRIGKPRTERQSLRR